MRRDFALKTGLVSAVLLLCGSIFAFDAVLTDDTVVALHARSPKLGASPTLRVDASHYALFKFDLAMVPPGTASGQVALATLTVFVDRVTRPGALGLYAVNGAWSEETAPVVTFTAMPVSPVAVIPANARNSFVRFDVTTLVRQWLDGAPNEGLAVGADESGPNISLTLDSKENIAGGHCARLDLERVGAGAGPAGAGSFSGAFAGNGAGLTNLSGAGLQPGSISLASLSSAVQTMLAGPALTNSAQTLTNLPMAGYIWQFQRTPVFEVNTFYAEGCAPNSGRVMHYIQKLAAHPNQVACGYDLVAIDDGWQSWARDNNGDLTWNPLFFSNSIPELANMAHTNGLRLGIYTAAGPVTCCGKLGSPLNCLYRDIQKFMSWGCDKVRIDQCVNMPYFNADGLRAVMRVANQAVADFNTALGAGAAKRGMVLEIVMNDGTWTAPALALGEAAFESNILAVRADTGPTFAEALAGMRPVLAYGSLIGPGHTGPILQFGGYRALAGIVTLGAMTLCGFSTPDVLPDLDLNTNQEVYAIYRDPLVRQASVAWSNALAEVWVRDLEGTDTHAVALINADNLERPITLTATMFGAGSSTVYNVRDVWNHENLPVFRGAATYAVPAASALLLKLSPAQSGGITFLTSDTATNATAYPGGSLAIAGGKLWVLDAGAWVAFNSGSSASGGSSNGTLSGDGGGLTNLNGGSIIAGTIPTGALQPLSLTNDIRMLGSQVMTPPLYSGTALRWHDLYGNYQGEIWSFLDHDTATHAPELIVESAGSLALIPNDANLKGGGIQLGRSGGNTHCATFLQYDQSAAECVGLDDGISKDPLGHSGLLGFSSFTANGLHAMGGIVGVAGGTNAYTGLTFDGNVALQELWFYTSLPRLSGIQPNLHWRTYPGILTAKMHTNSWEFMGNIAVNKAAAGSMITNGSLVWLTTNNTPSLALPDGSIATVSGGPGPGLYVREGGAWVRK